ncbi:hypothetical protein [Streptomyces sp. 1-11]|uniref:hypothetical protein n=1 Tax=unclassified Streptomyces TaxID=2593676 RepID=UPI00117159E7|nr:hypothetical protein [Streptomyces sp. 1-11]GEJ99330.1 hypothetical protein TNCT1_16070 [Streptomyces sp. 1-11]
MRAQESRISVALVSDLCHYPHEVWDLGLDQLDMFTEEVLEELHTIAWAEGNEYPNHSTMSAKTGQHNWGASGSFSEIIMEVSSNAGGGVGAVALTAAIKSVYEKLRSRAYGDVWRSLPSADQAVEIAKSALRRHYDVADARLTVIRSEMDAEAQRHYIEFSHEDGRKFGATVGAIKGMPSCTRVWAEGADLVPRPIPDPSTHAN